MNVFVCIGSRGEMMFAGRRVSFDSAVLADIVASCGKELFVDSYSVPLFERIGFTPTVFGQLGECGNYFIENRHLLDFADRIDTVTVYNFNRQYPLDFCLDLEPGKCGFVLLSHSEFAGSSHELITKEIWKNENTQ